MARSFGAESTPAMKILWHLRRHGGQASSNQVQEFVVSGAEYAVAVRSLKNAGAIEVVG